MKLKVFVLTLLISAAWVNIAYADAGYDAYEKGDYSEAYSIWRPRADAGEAYAQEAIGYLYFYGKGVLKDENKGVEWYEKAAFNGSAKAQKRMAVHYLKKVDDYSISMGWGGHNLGKARFWMEKLNNNEDSDKYKDKVEKWWNKFEIWKYPVDEHLIKKENESKSFFNKARSWFD